jgi:hypothetical protein
MRHCGVKTLLAIVSSDYGPDRHGLERNFWDQSALKFKSLTAAQVPREGPHSDLARSKLRGPGLCFAVPRLQSSNTNAAKERRPGGEDRREVRGISSINVLLMTASTDDLFKANLKRYPKRGLHLQSSESVKRNTRPTQDRRHRTTDLFESDNLSNAFRCLEHLVGREHCMEDAARIR